MSTTQLLLHTPCEDCGHPAFQHWTPRRSGHFKPLHCTYPLPSGSPFDPPCECPQFVPPERWPA